VLCSADRQDDQPLSWFSPKTAKSASPQSANDRDVSNLAGGNQADARDVPSGMNALVTPMRAVS
jgi:hypothetical protein